MTTATKRRAAAGVAGAVANEGRPIARGNSKGRMSRKMRERKGEQAEREGG